ncbi:MAG: carbon starvation CstA family protein [Planctomycetota bacterium]|jgi:carbon starvation protein
MSSLFVAGISILLLILGYIFYSKKVKQWIGLDDNEIPPSVSMNDGVDYVPAKHWTILFGHHFASIAGAAPIIGPVIACLYWGWLLLLPSL